MTGRIAGAPISWGVCEVPGWGHQLAPERVLREMKEIGLEATEAGPDGFLPDDPAELARVLDASSLRLVGGFTPVVLHVPGDGWRDRLIAATRRLAAAGGEVVVLAATYPEAGYDARPALSAAEWELLAARLDEAARLVADLGALAVLHPHVGTVIERPDEIERVLAETAIGLCLDTGHVMAGGGDPMALVAAAPERVRHVHAKDVDASLAGQVARGELPYSAAVKSGMFRPLGDGDVDVAGVVRALRGSGYTGWYVLEQDVMLDGEAPEGGGPRESVARSLAFLRDRLADAA